MRPKSGNWLLRVDLAKDIEHIARFYNRHPTAPRKIAATHGERFGDERPLTARGIGQPPEPWLDDMERERAAMLGGALQGTIVLHAQIPLRQDELHIQFSQLKLPEGVSR